MYALARARARVHCRDRMVFSSRSSGSLFLAAVSRASCGRAITQNETGRVSPNISAQTKRTHSKWCYTHM